MVEGAASMSGRGGDPPEETVAPVPSTNGDGVLAATVADRRDAAPRPVGGGAGRGGRLSARLSGWFSFDGLPAAVGGGDPARRRLTFEIVLVFAITLGMEGFRSLLSLVDSLLQTVPLAQQRVTLNAPAARHSLLDLLYQLSYVTTDVAWAGLGLCLLWWTGTRLSAIGLDRRRPWVDGGFGVLIALAIGIPGLGLYLGAHALGLSLTIVPTTLNTYWWTTPVLVLSAVGNAFVEESLVVGYLLTRLAQRGTAVVVAVGISAVIRGSYHLYQGFGGFAGNLVMGVIFALFWLRTRRLVPLIVAHSLIDIAAFVGYALLHTHVSWL